MKMAQVIVKGSAFEIQIFKGDASLDHWSDTGEPDGEWVTYKRWESHNIRDGEEDEHEIKWSYAGKSIDAPQYVHSSIVTAIFYLMKMGYTVIGAF